jgi:hypothetical protein
MFLDQMAYLDPKGDGDGSMPGKRRSCLDVRSDASRDPCDMEKAVLLKSQSPEDANIRPPERRPEPALHPASAFFRGWCNLRDVERSPVTGFKEMNGTPKSH